MFEEIGRQGDIAVRRTAEYGVIDAETQAITDQQAEQRLDGANKIAKENDQYVHKLRELGQTIGFTSVVDRLNGQLVNAPALSNFRAHSAELSWVPHAAAMTDEYGSPQDGVRAIYGWRMHWQNLSKNRPPEAAVVLFTQQHQGEVLPPRATVIGFNPAKNNAKGSREFTDLLDKDTFLYEEYSKLMKSTETPYVEQTPEERREFISGAQAIACVIFDKKVTWEAFHDNQVFFSQGMRSQQGLVDREGDYNYWLHMMKQRSQIGSFYEQYQEQGHRDYTQDFPRYTSNQLVAINALFAQPVTQTSLLGYRLSEGHSWRSLAGKLAKTRIVKPASLAIQRAWALPPDTKLINPALEQDAIAERLQDVILDR